MGAIGHGRQVILLCDSWYPKAEVVSLVGRFGNLGMVCNIRVDTALYGLPPARTGKRGRPRKRGDRILLDGVALSEPESGDWLVGVVPAITNLWKGRVVYARPGHCAQKREAEVLELPLPIVGDVNYQIGRAHV